jgi:hypothetical protein
MLVVNSPTCNRPQKPVRKYNEMRGVVPAAEGIPSRKNWLQQLMPETKSNVRQEGGPTRDPWTPHAGSDCEAAGDSGVAVGAARVERMMMRMPYWPFRSPFSLSSAFDGSA